MPWWLFWHHEVLVNSLAGPPRLLASDTDMGFKFGRPHICSVYWAGGTCENPAWNFFLEGKRPADWSLHRLVREGPGSFKFLR